MDRVDLLTAPDCAHCEDVRAALARLRAVRSDIIVNEIDAASPEGLRLSIAHGVLITPGVIVNGQFLAMGAVSEGALRRALGLPFEEPA